uniref:Uncharacterized protein n=1 Tax=Lepeophtheirus salmonis TaxID=72036 RepID=A0A0K2T0E1_LEPSM
MHGLISFIWDIWTSDNKVVCALCFLHSNINHCTYSAIIFIHSRITEIK